MATFRGQDGSFTFSGGVVGEVKEWTLNVSGDVLDTTTLGTAWKTNRGGMSSFTGTCRTNLDYGDTNQKAAIDKLIAAAPDGLPTACVFRVSATKTFSGTVVVNGVTFGANGTSIIEASLSFTGSGALTIAWA